MCLICSELEKGRLTSAEASRNLGEMRSSMSNDHEKVVKNKIESKEIEEIVEDLFSDMISDADLVPG